MKFFEQARTQCLPCRSTERKRRYWAYERTVRLAARDARNAQRQVSPYEDANAYALQQSGEAIVHARQEAGTANARAQQEAIAEVMAPWRP